MVGHRVEQDAGGAAAEQGEGVSAWLSQIVSD